MTKHQQKPASLLHRLLFHNPPAVAATPLLPSAYLPSQPAQLPPPPPPTRGAPPPWGRAGPPRPRAPPPQHVRRAQFDAARIDDGEFFAPPDGVRV